MYDYALTFGNEVELFWRRGPPVSRALMFCCRSLVVMYVTTTVIATYISPLYTTVSPFAAHWHEAFIERLHIPEKYRRKGEYFSHGHAFRLRDVAPCRCRVTYYVYLPAWLFSILVSAGRCMAS